VCLDAAKLASAAEQYLVVKGGECPPDVETLVRTGMLARIPTTAPSWALECGKEGVSVSAPGTDGELGTEDDLVHGEGRTSCKQ